MSVLPPSLLRFQSELEEAITRDLERSRVKRSRRRLVLRVAIVSLSAAVAFGVFSALPGQGRSTVERATTALQGAPNRVLHVELVSRWQPRNGPMEITRTESWDENGAPFAHRERVTVNIPNQAGLHGGLVIGKRRIYRWEHARTGLFYGPESLYDQVSNTIYVIKPTPRPPVRTPEFCSDEGVATAKQLHSCRYPAFAPGPEPGTVRLTSLTRLNNARPFRYRVNNDIVSAAEANRIRAKMVPTEAPEEFHRHRILQLLARKDTDSEKRVRAHGRDAIRLAWNSGRSVYLIDARSYDPIELRESNKLGTSTTRFLAYEELPPSKKTRNLLSLTQQHPSARIERDAYAFLAASLRLLPRG